MRLGLAEPLQKLVSEKFRSAYKDKSILFSETAVALLRSPGGAPVSFSGGQFMVSFGSFPSSSNCGTVLLWPKSPKQMDLRRRTRPSPSSIHLRILQLDYGLRVSQRTAHHTYWS